MSTEPGSSLVILHVGSNGTVPSSNTRLRAFYFTYIFLNDVTKLSWGLFCGPNERRLHSTSLSSWAWSCICACQACANILATGRTQSHTRGRTWTWVLTCRVLYTAQPLHCIQAALRPCWSAGPTTPRRLFAVEAFRLMPLTGYPTLAAQLSPTAQPLAHQVQPPTQLGHSKGSVSSRVRSMPAAPPTRSTWLSESRNIRSMELPKATLGPQTTSKGHSPPLYPTWLSIPLPYTHHTFRMWVVAGLPV